MKSRKIIWKRLLFILLVLSFSGCLSKKEKKYPFSSGDFLRYKVSRKNNRIFPALKVFIVYKITIAENGNFIVETGTELVNQKGKKGKVNSSTSKEYNPTGHLIGGKLPGGQKISNRNIGRLCNLWLPERKRKKGEKINLENFFTEGEVKGKTFWENKNVWEVKVSNKSYFYEEKTGILYGTFDGFQKTILIDRKISKL